MTTPAQVSIALLLLPWGLLPGSITPTAFSKEAFASASAADSGITSAEAGLAQTGLAAKSLASTAAKPKGSEQPAVWIRPQQIRPLSGQLNDVLMVNDNNPELITGEGILLSTFNDQSDSEQNKSGLNQPLNGRFDLFSHHVYAGKPDQLDSTLWLGLLAQPLGNAPVQVELLAGSTSLSQATEPGQTAAPFLPLPSLIPETTTAIAAGPGSKVAGDLLRREQAAELPNQWRLKSGSPTLLLALPIPVAGLDPLLNGRNLQMRLQSSAPIALASLASFGDRITPPAMSRWIELLNSGELSPKEHLPTPRGSRGKIIYSRVSGVQVGSTWRGILTDPGSDQLMAPEEPVSWPISSVERGNFATGKIQTAELKSFYPGTAWAAHGNYGVEYDLSIPLVNRSERPIKLALSLDAPLKTDKKSSGLSFRSKLTGPVVFRGPIEVTGLDQQSGRRPQGRRRFHLVLRQGQQGPSLGTISLAPRQTRRVQVRLIYPADATPPQVLTLQPVKQSRSISTVRP